MKSARRISHTFCVPLGTCCLLVAACCALAARPPAAYAQTASSLEGVSSNSSSNSTGATAKAGLASLPQDAQGPVSAALGKHDARYWAQADAAGLRVQNPQQALAVEFTRQGAELRSAATGELRGAFNKDAERWKLQTRAYGYGDVLRPVKTSLPRAEGNRVEYRRGALTEWYVNGPMGLEQGFTIAQAPGVRSHGTPHGGPLTVALDVTGDLAPALQADGTTVTLAHKDGRVAWRYRGLTARDAAGRELRSWLELRDRQLLLRVEDAGAQYPLVIDPWVQQAELTASDGAADDGFGFSVAVSGSTAVVGAHYHQVGSNAHQGATYVFVQSGSTWTQQAELTASDGAGGDNFGWSVAVSGGTAVVGAPYHQVVSNAYQGVAYVFVQSGSTWSQQAELTASDGAADNDFGYSVAVSGGTAVVGALYHKVGSNASQGAAYVFVQNGSTWSQQAELTASDGAASDLFGYSVAVSGGTAVVGALYHKVGSNASQGAAYVFVQSGSTWSRQAELTASDGAADDEFGFSVAVSGGTAVVGAWQHAVSSNTDQGAAYVFVQSGTSWSQQAVLTASDGTAGDRFGTSVAVSGGTAVVGADAHQVGSNAAQGAAYVFVQSGTTWSQQAELTASDGAADDVFGNSVAISGVTVVVGAFQHNAAQGAAYVFVPPATTTTTVASSANPSTAGTAVTFTAFVSAGEAPTGTVSFTANGAAISSSCTRVPLSADQAQCTTSTLATGSDLIVATYSGDSNNAGSSGDLTQVVNSSGKTATTTTVTSSLSPSTSGKSVTLTATVAPAGSPTPTGTVSFTANEAAITGCSAVTLSSSRTAACTTSALAVGTDAIVAVYSGDSHYAGSIGTFSQLVNPVASAVQFFPVTPCRLVDTRKADGPFGGPAIAGGTFRSFAIPDGDCGISASAVAYSLNVTVIVPNPPGTLGYLTIWPTGEGQPTVSTLNSPDGRTKANAAIVPAGTSGAVNVYASNTANVLLDINGYFAASSSSSLEFYSLTPCRVADTRQTSGYAPGLGSPALVAGAERNFPILSASGNKVPCDIPSTAQAYSLNFTVIPPATGDAVSYLTVWPEGETQPGVSTLNDPKGTTVANAALVPSGTNGGVAVYASNATNLLIDVNGYFAPPGTGGLQLYASTPCRVLDTRSNGGAFTGERTVNVAGSQCEPPSTAKAYVFSATVLPSGDLGYLTLWPDGDTQPGVSTLNAPDGAVTSNMAIVPNKDGDTDAFASGTTQLILDISACFAP